MTRWLRPSGLSAAAIVAATFAGCMQVPAYREPAGYSSTYHRHLKEAREMMYGEVVVTPPPVAPSADAPP